jgi:hypothetical protein
LTNADSPRASFIPDVPGRYILSLTVNDGCSSDTKTVQVNVNCPENGFDPEVTGPTEILTDGDGPVISPLSAKDCAASYKWTLKGYKSTLESQSSAHRTIMASFVLWGLVAMILMAL